MVGEIFGFPFTSNAWGNALKIVHHGWRNFWISIPLKCLEMHLKFQIFEQHMLKFYAILYYAVNFMLFFYILC